MSATFCEIPEMSLGVPTLRHMMFADFEQGGKAYTIVFLKNNQKDIRGYSRFACAARLSQQLPLIILHCPREKPILAKRIGYHPLPEAVRSRARESGGALRLRRGLNTSLRSTANFVYELCNKL